MNLQIYGENVITINKIIKQKRDTRKEEIHVFHQQPSGLGVYISDKYKRWSANDEQRPR